MSTGKLKRYLNSELKEFRASLNDDNAGGTNFSLVYPADYKPTSSNRVNKKDGFAAARYRGWACYGSLRVTDGTYSGCVGMIDYPSYNMYRHLCLQRKRKGFSKLQLDYVNYIVKRSPFAEAFISKSGRRALEIGSIKDVSWPAQYVISSGQVIRNISEWPHQLDLWDRFRQLTDENTALALSFLFKEKFNPGEWGEKAKPLKILNWSPNAGQHSCYNVLYYGKEGTKNFINNDKKFFKDRPSFSECVDFRLIGCIWRGEWDHKFAPDNDKFVIAIQKLLRKTDIYFELDFDGIPDFITNYKKLVGVK